MKKFILGLMAVIGLGTAVSSCNDNDDNPPFVTQQTVGSTLAIMKKPDGSVQNITNVSYKLTWNYTAKTADIDITGLANPTGSFYPTLKFRNVKFSLDPNTGLKTINVTNLTPETSNGIGAIAFASFKLRLLDRIINQSYSPGFYVTITTAEGTSYVGFPDKQYWIGTTVSTNDKGDEYASENCMAIVQPDLEADKVGFYLNNFSLESGEPDYTVTLTKLECKFDPLTGEFTAERAASWSQSVSGPTSQATFSNLKATGDFNGNLRIEFDIKANETAAHVVYTAGIDTGNEE